MCDPLSPGKEGGHTIVKDNNSHIDLGDPTSLLIENFDGFYPK